MQGKDFHILVVFITYRKWHAFHHRCRPRTKSRNKPPLYKTLPLRVSKEIIEKKDLSRESNPLCEQSLLCWESPTHCKNLKTTPTLLQEDRGDIKRGTFLQTFIIGAFLSLRLDKAFRVSPSPLGESHVLKLSQISTFQFKSHLVRVSRVGAHRREKTWIYVYLWAAKGMPYIGKVLLGQIYNYL